MKPEQWQPEAYQRRAGFVPAAGAELIELLAPREGERILDLGCGDGVLTARLAQRGARIVGVDSSNAMLDAARARLPALTFFQADGQALTFHEEFDAVFSNAAMHWMPQADAVAQGAFRALVPGGRFVFEMGGHGNIARVLAGVAHALTVLVRSDINIATWYFPTLGEQASVLERSGFHVTWAHVFPRHNKVEGEGTESGIAGWLRLFAADSIAALGADRARFFALVEEHCREQLFREDAWWIDYVRLRMIAERPR